jgi:uncharacterized membrane protein
MKRGLVAVCILFLTTTLHAGVVFLNDGNYVEGNIITSDSNNIVMETVQGRIVIRMSLVKELVANAADFDTIAQQRVSNANVYLSRIHSWNATRLTEFGDMTSGIPRSYRMQIYEESHKRYAGLYAFANIIPSLGSWIQGDYGTAGGVLGGMAICITLTILCDPYSGDFVAYPAQCSGFYVSALSGVILYAYGIARPFQYAREWNATVRKKLELTLLPTAPDTFYASPGTVAHLNLAAIRF